MGDPTESIDNVKRMIEESEFIPSADQRLVCANKNLTGSLAECGVQDADTMELLLDVVGGVGGHRNNPWKKASAKMRWKWKKKRTRRLMRRRRKMRQRAR